MARRVPTEHQMTRRVATVLVLAFGYPFAGLAADEAESGARESAETPRVAARGSAPVARVPIQNSADPSANPYAGISNEQLADVADRWDGLSRDERRWFFVEVRKRLMATDGAPALPIGASARFGQVVRNRDGTVTRIQTPRVTAQPAGTTNAGDDPRAYGLGFERRLEVRTRSGQSPEGSPGATQASAQLPARERPRPGKRDGGS